MRDLRFEDSHGPRSSTVMNRWLRELPVSGAVAGDITDLEAFRTMALSRLAAQHDEIAALRSELRTADNARVRVLPTR